MHCLILFNGNSGSASNSLFSKIEHEIRKKIGDVSVAITYSQEDSQLVIKENIGITNLFVIVGGDGALNSAIQLLFNENVYIYYIPLGTANVFAIEHNIPFNVVKAARGLNLDTAKAFTPSAGVIEYAQNNINASIYFLLMVGFGYDAHVVERVERYVPFWSFLRAMSFGRIGSIVKKCRYIIEGSISILTSSSYSEPIEYFVNDHIHRSSGVIIGCVDRYAGDYCFQIDDDKLKNSSLFVADLGANRIDVAISLLKIFTRSNQVCKYVKVSHPQTNEGVVTVNNVKKCQIDGEFVNIVDIIKDYNADFDEEQHQKVNVTVKSATPKFKFLSYDNSEFENLNWLKEYILIR